MPTYRNDGDRAIIYNEPDGKDIIIIDPGKEIQLSHWIPYKRLGLTLVNESYPPVPNTVLVSGDFQFTQGMERKFDIEPCRKYELDIYPSRGEMRLYLGASPAGRVISEKEYHEEHEWKYVPYVRVVGESEDSSARMQAMLKE